MSRQAGCGIGCGTVLALVVLAALALSLFNSTGDGAEPTPARARSRGAPSPTRPTTYRLRYLVRVRGHADIPRSRSGVPRSVHFFVDGGRNVAIDALDFNLKRAREIVRRADAEANKIRDVREAGGDMRFIVFYVPNPSPEMHAAIEQALKILRAADVETTSDEQAIQHLVAAEL